MDHRRPSWTELGGLNVSGQVNLGVFRAGQGGLMSIASHHPHRGPRGMLGLGVVVAGVTVALSLVVMGPSVALAAAGDPASNPFVVYLVLPNGTAGESKSTATTG